MRSAWAKASWLAKERSVGWMMDLGGSPIISLFLSGSLSQTYVAGGSAPSPAFVAARCGGLTHFLLRRERLRHLCGQFALGRRKLSGPRGLPFLIGGDGGGGLSA